MAFFITWVFETVEQIKQRLFEYNRKIRLQKATYNSEEYKRAQLRKKRKK